MPEEAVTTALLRALLAPAPAPGLVVHSEHGTLRSQSRRGDCYDHALPGTTQAESVWSRLKTEVLELREWPVFADLTDAQVSVVEYFDYYNHERLHSSISYQTPYFTYQQLFQTTVLNCPA